MDPGSSPLQQRPPPPPPQQPAPRHHRDPREMVRKLHLINKKKKWENANKNENENLNAHLHNNENAGGGVESQQEKDKSDEEHDTSRIDLDVVYELIHNRDWDTLRDVLNNEDEASKSFFVSLFQQQDPNFCEDNDGDRSDGEENNSGGDDDDDDDDDDWEERRRRRSCFSHSHTNPSQDQNQDQPNHDKTDEAPPLLPILHSVCKQQPPLSIIDRLLDLNEKAAGATAKKIAPQVASPAGPFGYLPLHYACSFGASPIIVARLIEAYPHAARSREALEQAIPLHLAVTTATTTITANDGDDSSGTEDSTAATRRKQVLMILLTTHPEGALVKDASGRKPLDHVKKQLSFSNGGSNHHQILEHMRQVLEVIAPTLIRTSQAATQRVSEEYESVKLRGLQEAHLEYVRQLEAQFEDEREEFTSMEIQFHNALAEEKEQNITLTKRVLELQDQMSSLRTEKVTLSKLLDSERRGFQIKSTKHEKQLKEMILRSEICKAAGLEEPKEGSDNNNILVQLSNLLASLKDTQSRLSQVEKDSESNGSMVKHLNQLLSSKDSELEQLRSQLAAKEEAERTALDQVEKLTSLQSAMQKDLDIQVEDKRKLVSCNKTQAAQLEEARRTIHVQETRLGSIKSSIASLSYNFESWALDDNDELNSSSWEHKSSSQAMARRTGGEGPGSLFVVGPPNGAVLEGMETLQNNHSQRNNRGRKSPPGTNNNNSGHLKQHNGTQISPLGSPNRPSCDTSDGDKSVGDTNETALSTRAHEDDDDMSALTPHTARPNRSILTAPAFPQPLPPPPKRSSPNLVKCNYHI